jgi:HAD superfamily hydrolase (TIGR01509 family)
MAPIKIDEVDAAVLDLDGVVTDTADAHAAAWAELFDHFLATACPGAAPFDPDGDYRRFVDGKPRADGVESFLASRGVHVPYGRPDDPPTASTVFGLGHRKDDLFRERLRRDGVRVYPGTIDFVQALRARGRHVAVVSASRNCHDVLDAGGVLGLFDVIVDGMVAADNGLPGKPDPATFLLAARRLGSVPARTLLVEDALAGIEAGRRGGFGTVIGVDRHHHADELRRAGADIVVTDLADLAFVGDGPMLSAAWTIVRDESASSPGGREHDALFAVANGTVGVRGDLLTGAPGRAWLTLVAGAFGRGAPSAGGGAADGDHMVRLLPGPSFGPIASSEEGSPPPATRWTLDLRSGVLESRPIDDVRGVSTIRFASLARPGLVAIRATSTPGQRWAEHPLQEPRLESSETLGAAFTYREGSRDSEVCWAETRSDRAHIGALARQQSGNDPRAAWLERLTVFHADANGLAHDGAHDAERALAEAANTGFEKLLGEQRDAWAKRWDGADIEIDGDDSAQSAIRYALFHLMSCAPTSGEAGVGARGLTGLAYAGHVFWDADVFVLPALAATLPEAARAMLEYRIQRLPAARRAAKANNREGARFPWESADTGEDVTPTSVRDHEGKIVEILTGSHEEHITSDVAWAALHYLEWSGDAAVIEGDRGGLVTETARYWASRIRVDREGLAHLYGVMGPDEYHEVVDDNAFTNILVRWHLRRAAELLHPADRDEAAHWRQLADALTTGFDPVTRRHEQFAGFWQLEPLRIADIAEVPIAADVLLGHRRVTQAQVLKQPDVLMAHHLLPGEVPRGSLEADLAFYLPRTAHGSSLSPAICAGLLARAGRPDEALELFDLASHLDLDDLTGMTGGGLHLATFGGLWQAVVYGFGGVRPAGGVLCVEPALPTRWTRLRIRVRFRQVAIRLELAHDRVVVEADGACQVSVHGVVVEGSAELVRDDEGWKQR